MLPITVKKLDSHCSPKQVKKIQHVIFFHTDGTFHFTSLYLAVLLLGITVAKRRMVSHHIVVKEKFCFVAKRPKVELLVWKQLLCLGQLIDMTFSQFIIHG